MESDVVLSDRDEALLEKVIDVSARDVQRDELRALLHAGRGGIRASRLTANFSFAAAAVEKELIDYQVALERP